LHKFASKYLGLRTLSHKYISRKQGMTATAELLPTTFDNTIWYARSRSKAKYHQLFTTKEVGAGIGDRYNQLELPGGSSRPLTKDEKSRPNLIPSDCKVWMPCPLTSSGFRKNTSVLYAFEGKIYDTGKNQNWKTTIDGLNRLAELNRIVPSRTTLNFKRYLNDFPAIALTNI
jgi:adenine-specific DNA-methyltransferase